MTDRNWSITAWPREAIAAGTPELLIAPDNSLGNLAAPGSMLAKGVSPLWYDHSKIAMVGSITVP